MLKRWRKYVRTIWIHRKIREDLCSWLNVSRSGYYAWLKRPMSAYTISDAKLLTEIEPVFNLNHQKYGSPRVFHALKREGIFTSKNRDARLM